MPKYNTNLQLSPICCLALDGPFTFVHTWRGF